MPDNLTTQTAAPATIPTGIVVATDDVGGVHFQKMKLDVGGDGASSQVSATNPVPAKLTNGTTDVGIEAFGQLLVNNGYQTLFYDAWNGALDTTEKWTVTGNAPTIGNGNMTMAATLSSYNAIRTKDTIRANGGFTHVRNGISLEASAATGAGRFWGLGTTATTPAPAVLAQDGVGFEIDQATGALLAVTYAAGVRTTVATLTRPSDGAQHAYGLSFRVTRVYWFLDDMQVPVATAAFPNVQVSDLPALIVRQNAASFTGTPSFVNIAHLTADTSRQGFVVSDPVIGTRQARVKAPSTAAVASDQALVVALHPSSPMPTSAAPMTYSVSATIAPAALATDIFTIAGSASKVVRVTKVSVNGVQTTAGQAQVILLRRSTANTGGTSTAPAKVAHDTQNTAAVATVLAYTANPTALGTLVGTVRADRVFLPGAATASDAQGLDHLFGDAGQQSPTLRATTDLLAVNLNGVTIAGGSLNVTVEWTES